MSKIGPTLPQGSLQNNLFASLAPRLFDNGFTPIPVCRGTKRPAIKNWTNIDYNAKLELLDTFCRDHASASIGIVLGRVCAIDIDVLDEKTSHRFQQIVTNKLGDAPCRVGQWPKRALFFRVTGEPFSKLATRACHIDGEKAQVEILCAGQQVVVFGIHPDTGQSYTWVDESILDLDVEQLPTISRRERDNLVQEIEKELSSLSDILPSNLSSLGTNVSIGFSDKFVDGRSAEITEALNFLDPQDYDTWIAVGHALKSAEDDFLSVFLNWSKRRPDGSIPRNFLSEVDVEARWESFRPIRTSLASIFRKAADSGWTGNTLFKLNSCSHTEIARYILADLELSGPRPVFADGDLWQFSNTNWQQVADYEQRLWVQALDGLQFGKNNFIRANKSLIDGVLSELRANCATPNFFNDAPMGINCLSGFIQFDKNGKAELFPHSPSQKQRFCITANWYSDASSILPPLTERFFSGIVGGGEGAVEKRRLLEELLGAACAGLGTKLKAPKCFVLHGQSAANGKSQFIQLIRGMLPPTAHSAIAPSEMGKEQFLAELVGKVANFAEELSSGKAIASDKMKTVISGDVVSAKRVYRPVYQFVPLALHIFTANILPSFNDGVDEGIRRRFVVLPFTEQIPESKRIPNIAGQILQNEKTAILKLAVEGAARLVESGQYSIPQSILDETEEWFQEADNLRGWLEDGGLEKLLQHHENFSYDDAYRRFREDIQERDPREWVARYSVFKRIVREHVRKDPELDIVRRSHGYRIIERVLV